MVHSSQSPILRTPQPFPPLLRSLGALTSSWGLPLLSFLLSKLLHLIHAHVVSVSGYDLLRLRSQFWLPFAFAGFSPVDRVVFVVVNLLVAVRMIFVGVCKLAYGKPGSTECIEDRRDT